MRHSWKPEMPVSASRSMQENPSPAEGVTQALDILGAMRIDTAYGPISDPDLLKRLADGQITLNTCPTSNLMELYKTMDEHPLKDLYNLGIPVTVSTG